MHRLPIELGLLLLILNISTAFAQNWTPISITGKTNYKAHNLSIYPIQAYSLVDLYYVPTSIVFRTIEVDSVQQVNGLTNYFFNDVSFLAAGVGIKAHQPNFLERKMVSGGGGVYNFYDPDTLVLNTQASINDSWTYNQNTQNIATVTNIVQDTVLGQVDSIKVIHLSLGDSILLSKNHGIVYFPDTSDLYYTLAGIEYTPTNFIGQQMPSTSNTYDYEVGDVLVYESRTVYINSSSLLREKYTVLSKSGNNYTFRKESFQKNNNYGNQSITTAVGTTSLLPYYHDEELVSNGEIMASNYPQEYRLCVITEDRAGKAIKKVTPFRLSNYSPNPGIYNIISSSKSRFFASGLGFLYDEESNHLGSFENQLVAYVKDGVLVGDTTTLSSLVPITKIEKLPIEVKTFPQPTDVLLNIELDGSALELGQVQLLNSAGQLVLECAYKGENIFSIDVTGVEQGIYILKIITDEKYATKKVVIGH
ncbi:T9SS type A sorting domain-containing protein [Aureispira sp. CCB-QB1]|uniref:T9SS type A sorting domain-containing protein n=1 Tax=Aureispira sp. CCB-QB1 TaxID=1313421 RepID=UPI0006967213|nr:T9SS type A sorting domain-containing protein [Aureispira sp. CCB-QB1]